jgi:zinc protease
LRPNLFPRGVENINATNAGVEAFMLNVASEASASYPRDRMRKDLARMGTVIGESVSYDYSTLAMTATRTNFDKSWDIFADVAMNPSFTKEDVDLVKNRLVSSLSDDTDEPDTYLQRLQEKWLMPVTRI